MQHARGTLQEPVNEFKQALLDDSDDESEESSPDTDDGWKSANSGDHQTQTPTAEIPATDQPQSVCVNLTPDDQQETRSPICSQSQIAETGRAGHDKILLTEDNSIDVTPMSSNSSMIITPGVLDNRNSESASASASSSSSTSSCHFDSFLPQRVDVVTKVKSSELECVIQREVNWEVGEEEGSKRNDGMDVKTLIEPENVPTKLEVEFDKDTEVAEDATRDVQQSVKGEDSTGNASVKERKGINQQLKEKEEEEKLLTELEKIDLKVDALRIEDAEARPEIQGRADVGDLNFVSVCAVDETSQAERPEEAKTTIEAKEAKEVKETKEGIEVKGPENLLDSDSSDDLHDQSGRGSTVVPFELSDEFQNARNFFERSLASHYSSDSQSLLSSQTGFDPCSLSAVPQSSAAWLQEFSITLMSLVDRLLLQSSQAAAADKQKLLKFDRLVKTQQQTINDLHEKYKSETDRLQSDSVAAHQKALDGWKQQNESLAEQYKKLQQSNCELAKKQAGDESALHDRIKQLEMKNEDLTEQLESSQQAHSHSHDSMTSEVSDLSDRCLRLESLVEIHLTTLKGYRNRDEEKNKLVDCLESDLKETKDVNVQNESRISGLESRLKEAKRQLAETKQKVEEQKDQLKNVTAQCEEFKREAEEARTRAATKEQQNEELISTKTEESEFALDRRIVEAKVKDYYKLLSPQGVVTVLDKSTEEMLYVVCEAAGLPKDIYQVCLGVSAAAEERVNRTRAASIIPTNPDDSNPQDAQREQPPAAAGEQQPAAPTRIPTSLKFVKYL